MIEMCCIAGCETEATKYFQSRPYCVTHWQEERDGAVLAEARKPVQAPIEWEGAAGIRENGLGQAVDPTTLPTVRDSVAEECRRELEAAAKDNYRRR
jgi:hypothetical protein